MKLTEPQRHALRVIDNGGDQGCTRGALRANGVRANTVNILRREGLVTDTGWDGEVGLTQAGNRRLSAGLVARTCTCGLIKPSELDNFAPVICPACRILCRPPIALTEDTP